MSVLTIDPEDIRPLEPANIVWGTMAEAATLGDVLRRDDDGNWVLANASTLAGCQGQVGIAISGSRKDSDGDLADGEMAGVCVFGRVTGFTSLDPTSIGYYVGDSAAGDIETTAGTISRFLAVAESAITLFVMPVGEASS
jgi:hypothetical protein